MDLRVDPHMDPSVCPLCSGDNACANEVQRTTGVAQGPCWCTTAAFTPALLARIPDHARRLACVCAGRAATVVPDQATP